MRHFFLRQKPQKVWMKILQESFGGISGGIVAFSSQHCLLFDICGDIICSGLHVFWITSHSSASRHQSCVNFAIPFTPAILRCSHERNLCGFRFRQLREYRKFAETSADKLGADSQLNLETRVWYDPGCPWAVESWAGAGQWCNTGVKRAASSLRSGIAVFVALEKRRIAFSSTGTYKRREKRLPAWAFKTKPKRLRIRRTFEWCFAYKQLTLRNKGNGFSMRFCTPLMNVSVNIDVIALISIRSVLAQLAHVWCVEPVLCVGSLSEGVHRRTHRTAPWSWCGVWFGNAPCSCIWKGSAWCWLSGIAPCRMGHVPSPGLKSTTISRRNYQGIPKSDDSEPLLSGRWSKVMEDKTVI